MYLRHYVFSPFLTAQAGLSEAEQEQMRKMLNQKESNYNRLRRAKMDKSMFVKIKTLGIGAFGEVCLTRKVDTGALYAMKTLRKKDVLNRNQVNNDVVECFIAVFSSSLCILPVTPLIALFFLFKLMLLCKLV